MMKKTLAALMMVCLAGAFCIKAAAQDSAAGEKAPAKGKYPTQITVLSGEIAAVDQKLKTITVRDASGAEKTFSVSKGQIKNLKLSRKVKVSYTTDSTRNTTKVVKITPIVEQKAKITAKQGTAETK